MAEADKNPSIAMTVGYYAEVASLSPQKSSETATVQSGNDNNINSGMIYSPVIIFFALFISAFGMLLMNRVNNWKHRISAFVIALFLASTPTVISLISGGMGVQIKAGPEFIPRQVKVAHFTRTGVVVTWHTDAPAVGGLRISTAPFDRESSNTFIAGNGEKTSDHTIKVESLSPGQIYEMEIYSGNGWYDDRGSPVRFTLE